MLSLQKAGAVAALVEALAYVIGFGVMATLLNPGDTEGWNAAQKLAFMLEKKALFQLWTIFIYVIFGIVLVVLTASLHQRLVASSPALMQVATPFGFIWAGLVIASGMVASVGIETVATLHAIDVSQAVSTWTAIGAVQDGLGGGVEIVGGLWVLLLSAASLRSRAFPRALSWLGVIVGLTGALTVIPVLSDLGAVFGLGQIAWFVWVGVSLLQRSGVD